MPHIVVYAVALVFLVFSVAVMVRRYRADMFQLAMVTVVLVQMAGRTYLFSGWSKFFAHATTACLVLLLYVAWTQLKARTVAPAKVHLWIGGFLLALTAMTIASSLWSVDPINTAFVSTRWAIFICAVLVASAGRWLDREKLLGDLRALFVFSNVILIGGIVGTYTGVFRAGISEGGSYQGVFSNPNTTGSIAALIIFLGYGLLRCGAIALPASLSGTSLKRAVGTVGLSIVVLGPALWGLAFSNSNASQVGVLAGALVIVALSGRKGAIAVGALAAVGVVAVGAFFAGLIPGVSPDRLSGFTFSGRTPYWKAGIDLLVERPWGYGLGTSRNLISDLHEAGVVATPLNAFHNAYLQIAIEASVLALVAVLCAFVLLAIPMVATRGDRLAVGLSGLIVAGMVARLAESLLFSVGGGPFPFFFWYAVGGLLAVYSVGKAGAIADSVEERQPNLQQ